MWLIIIGIVIFIIVVWGIIISQNRKVYNMTPPENTFDKIAFLNSTDKNLLKWWKTLPSRFPKIKFYYKTDSNMFEIYSPNFNRNGKLNSDLEQTKKQLETFLVELDENKDACPEYDNSECTVQIAELNDSLNECTNLNTTLELGVTSLKSEIADLNSSLVQSEENIKKCQVGVDKCRLDNQEISDRLDDTTKNYQTCIKDKSQIQTDYDTCSTNLENKTKELNSTNLNYSRCQKTLEEKIETINKCSFELSSEKGKNSTCESSLDRFRNNLNNCKSELEDNKINLDKCTTSLGINSTLLDATQNLLNYTVLQNLPDNIIQLKPQKNIKGLFVYYYSPETLIDDMKLLNNINSIFTAELNILVIINNTNKATKFRYVIFLDPLNGINSFSNQDTQETIIENLLVVFKSNKNELESRIYYPFINRQYELRRLRT